MKPDTSFVLKSGHFHLLTTLKGRRSSCAMSTRNSQERNVRNCLTDEGRPLEVGLQERTSNHLSAAVDKSHGRGAEGKGLARPGQVSGKKRTARKPLLNCRNLLGTMIQKEPSAHHFPGHRQCAIGNP